MPDLSFAAVASRNPVAGTRAGERLDPYVDGLWESGSSVAWFESGIVASQRDAGLVAGGMWSRPADPAESLRRVCAGPRRDIDLAVLAAVNLWRTATHQQLAAIVGSPGVASRRPASVHRLWSAGLVDVGVPASITTTSQLPMLVRPAARGGFDRLAELVSFDDWVGLTAGQPWRRGSQHDRHNVLVTELALRAGELTSVAAVVGEQLAAVGRMAVPGLTVPVAAANLAGDALLVRGDGLRIVVELTVSTGNLEAKAARWAQMLAADTNRLLAVCFVHAPHPSLPDAGRAGEVRKKVKAAANGSVSQVVAGVPARMSVARWTDWFPSRLHASDGFGTLRAWRPTGGGERPWRPVDLLDPFDLPGPLDRSGLALVDNAAWLFGVPHWLRADRALTPSEAWAAEQRITPFPRMAGVNPPPQDRAAAARELEDLWA